MKKTFIHTKFIIIIIAMIFFAMNNNIIAGMIQPGEELDYEVSYFGIKLGKIKMITEDYQTLDGKKVCKTKAYIDSYSGIPFVSLHVIYNSWFDTTVSYSYKLVSQTEQSDKQWLYEKLVFDYDNQRLLMERYMGKKFMDKNSIHSKKRWNEGLSLFNFARQYTKSKKAFRLPCHIMDTITTTINFVGKRETVSVNAINYPVKTVYFYGNLQGEGIYGITGKFEGWFSDDEASIPIHSTLNLYVGHVNVDLIAWKRKNWAPPRG